MMECGKTLTSGEKRLWEGVTESRQEEIYNLMTNQVQNLLDPMTQKETQNQSNNVVSFILEKLTFSLQMSLRCLSNLKSLIGVRHRF